MAGTMAPTMVVDDDASVASVDTSNLSERSFVTEWPEFDMAGQNPPTGHYLPAVRVESEFKLGIKCFASFGDYLWHGDVRKRFTDFLVNEVTRKGEVLHLLEMKEVVASESQKTKEHKPQPPKTPADVDMAIPEADVQILKQLLGETTTRDLLELYSATTKNITPVTGPSVALAVIDDRAERGRLHQEIRRIFSGRFETRVDPNTSLITATAVRKGKGRQRGRQGNNTGGYSNKQQGGDYLHFTLYKENKDTMEAINQMARLLKIKSSAFGFAGTKDRRAATTQRVSVFRQSIDSLNWLNARNPAIKVGDFRYHAKPISLGQHGGNEFVIVVKNVEVDLDDWDQADMSRRIRETQELVQLSLDSILKNGFINYFGLQRFGTHTIGTQDIGQRILKGNFESAVEALLHVDACFIDNPQNVEQLESVHHRDEINRARALTIWKMSGDVTAALKVLPKRFGAESCIIRHLGRSPETRHDYCGAILQITRGLRNLYIHAYQSYVWNWVVTRRWAKYGNEVLKGDLILLETQSDIAHACSPATYMGEEPDRDEEEYYQSARALTAEDIASGQYSIKDVVYPVPGYDVLYPENEVADYYTQFMGREENGGLDPYQMRRRQREFSLSGHYRKLVAQFTAVPKFYVRPYSDDSEQMHPTDLDMLRLQKAKETRANHEDKDAASAWRNLAANPGKHDDELADERRRRRAMESPAEPPEKRINDKWIETTLDGGSKRMKVDQPPVFSTTQGQENAEIPTAQDTPATQAAPTAEASSADQEPPMAVGMPAKFYVPAVAPPHIVRYDLLGMGTIDMETTQGWNPDGTHMPPTEREVREALQAAAPYPLHAPNERPETDSMILDTPQTPAATQPLIEHSETGQPITNAPQTSAAPSPPQQPAGAASSSKPKSGGDQSPQLWEDDLFLTAPDGPDDKAMNLTPKYTDIPDHQNKVAVVLNIRLNSSNYATICIREAMARRWPIKEFYKSRGVKSPSLETNELRGPDFKHH